MTSKNSSIQTETNGKSQPKKVAHYYTVDELLLMYSFIIRMNSWSWGVATFLFLSITRLGLTDVPESEKRLSLWALPHLSCCARVLTAFGMCLAVASAFLSLPWPCAESVCTVADSITYSAGHVLHSFHKLSYTCWSGIAGWAPGKPLYLPSVQGSKTFLGFKCNCKRQPCPLDSKKLPLPYFHFLFFWHGELIIVNVCTATAASYRVQQTYHFVEVGEND